MATTPDHLPTRTELAILQVLWDRGPSTVREVRDALRRPAGYTTVLKLLQLMRDKGLVTRDETAVRHVYAAARPAETTRRRLLGDLVDRAFGGSAKALVLQALSSRRATPEELAEIRREIDAALERGRR